jgi:COX assembly mitochondrial protein 1
MNGCMLQYQNQEELDKARKQWFELAGERKRAREEEVRKTEELREMKRDWWRDFQSREEAERGKERGGEVDRKGFRGR